MQGTQCKWLLHQGLGLCGGLAQSAAPRLILRCFLLGQAEKQSCKLLLKDMDGSDSGTALVWEAELR